MQQNQQLKGAILVFIGAMSYGILATMVKSANLQNVPTSVLTFMQFAVGVTFLLIYSRVGNSKTVYQAPQKKSIFKLMVFGSTFGMTSLFYYMSIQYVPVSIGIILLMQAIWMSIILEAIVKRTKPSGIKIIGTLTILLGTLFATNVFFEPTSLDYRGILLGLLAATSFTISMYTSGNIETQVDPKKKSLYMILGGFIFVCLYWNYTIIANFQLRDALMWGIPLGVFGTIIPPLLFSKGMALTGSGIGAIISAVEIPVSILSAHLFLNEKITGFQWIGVVIILCAIVFVNSYNRRPS